MKKIIDLDTFYLKGIVLLIYPVSSKKFLLHFFSGFISAAIFFFAFPYLSSDINAAEQNPKAECIEGDHPVADSCPDGEKEMYHEDISSGFPIPFCCPAGYSTNTEKQLCCEGKIAKSGSSYACCAEGLDVNNGFPERSKACIDPDTGNTKEPVSFWGENTPGDKFNQWAYCSSDKCRVSCENYSIIPVIESHWRCADLGDRVVVGGKDIYCDIEDDKAQWVDEKPDEKPNEILPVTLSCHDECKQHGEIIYNKKGEEINFIPDSEYSTCCSCVCVYTNTENPDSTCEGSLSKNVWTEVGCITATQEGITVSVMRIFVGIATGLAVFRFVQAGFLLNNDDPEKIKEGKSIALSALAAIAFGAIIPILLYFIGIDILGISWLAQFFKAK